MMHVPDADVGLPKINADWVKLPLFDRAEWKRFAFGAFAESVNDRVEPADAADEIYVGLEHLEPQDLHIRRWGKGSDVIGTKLRFRKGDLIFGRRRAYQRKLAVAGFDGICSAHAMVVRAKSDVVLPEFLPFLMMSGRFMRRAVEISVGSLSPTINWTALKSEEFFLPTLRQQRRIAEALTIAQDVTETRTTLLDATRAARDAFAASAFSGVNIRSAIEPLRSARLGDVFQVQTGGTPSRGKSEYWGGNIPWIKTGEINYSDIYDSEEKITALGLEKSAARLFPPDSILMALYGQGPTLGRVARLRVQASVNQACAVIFPTKEYSMRYLYHYLAGQYSEIRGLARGASQPNINALIVKDFAIPVAKIEQQRAVEAVLDQYERACRDVTQAISCTSSLIREFSNTLG
jgi:type I restriction enzyme, S subunit